MNWKCYACEHIKTCKFRLCIQLMGYEGSHKQNNFLTMYIFRATIFLYYIHKESIPTCVEILFSDSSVSQLQSTATCKSICIRAHLSAKVGRLKCEVTDPEGLVYRSITVHLEVQKRLVSWLIIYSSVEKSTHECQR
jgi:hypothetical protein